MGEYFASFTKPTPPANIEKLRSNDETSPSLRIVEGGPLKEKLPPISLNFNYEEPFPNFWGTFRIFGKGLADRKYLDV